MANILINVQGLLEGKRLRKLGLKARLYYPLLLGLANTFARLELDYDLLAARFITFHDPETANIADWFKEYEKAKLVFIYDGHDAGAEEPTRWAQFDTPVEFRRSFATKEDNDSPEPPEPAYENWLKSIHGAEWEQFHLTKYQRERQSDISGKRATAGRKGAAATNAKRWGTDSEGQQNQQTDFADSANRQSHLGVVLGVDEVEGRGEGEGVGEGTTSFNLKSETESLASLESSLTNSGTGKTTTEAPVKGSANGDIPTPKDEKVPSRICPHCSRRIAGKSPEYLANHIKKNHPATAPAASADADFDLDDAAAELARAWNLLMQYNEKFDPSKLPAKWETLWTADFRKLLNIYPPSTVEGLMAYSQSDSQREYNWNCKVFYGNCERNLKFMEATKKTSKWKPVLERYVAIVTTGNLPPEYEIEFLDEQPNSNVEDEYDELADDDDDLA